MASAVDREKQIVADKQAKKATALLQQERTSNLKEKRMLLVPTTAPRIKPISTTRNVSGSKVIDPDYATLHTQLETVITDGLDEFCNQPIPVVGMLEEPEL